MGSISSGLKNKNLFRKNTPLYLTFLLTIISGALVYSFFPHPSEGKKITIVSSSSDCIPEMDVLRSREYKLTHRVLLSNTKNETSKFADLKDRINRYIAECKTSKGVNDVSVYYRSLAGGAWFQVNGGIVYNPASLMKVPYLITILKQAQNSPGFLDKKIYFDNHFAQGNDQNIKDFKLQEHTNYTIRQLLQYMIVHSDNDATVLVSQNVNQEVFSKLFSDLEIPATPTNGGEYFINVLDCSKFFRVLYNSSYLDDEYSEFALELLSKTSYKDGLLKNLDANFPVAHKFGERIINAIQELHEIGIFYVDNHPYVLGVMSSGHDLNQLSSVLSDVSKMVYEENNKSN
jgi:beta-lactamase class A